MPQSRCERAAKTLWRMPTHCVCSRGPTCRNIPLNKLGETVDSLYRTVMQAELEATVVTWLKETIERLHRETEEGPTVHVKGKVVSIG